MTDTRPEPNAPSKPDTERLEEDLRRMDRPDREIDLPDQDNEGAGDVTHLVP